MLPCCKTRECLQGMASYVSSELRMVNTAFPLCSSPQGVEKGRKHLSFTTLHLNKLKDARKKAIYHVCVKVLNLQSLAGLVESRWAEFCGSDVSPKGSWQSLYCCPLRRAQQTFSGGWVVHDAIATNRHREHMDATPPKADVFARSALGCRCFCLFILFCCYFFLSWT